MGGINYVIKTENLDYFVYNSNRYLPNGTQFIYDGVLCTVISNNGKI